MNASKPIHPAAAVRIIERTWPADSPEPGVRNTALDMLERALLETNAINWRQLPPAVLDHYARQCVNREAVLERWNERNEAADREALAALSRAIVAARGES